MKKFIVIIFAISTNQIAQAGSVAGFGGSTEYTQLLNNIQLVTSYARQVDQYIMQGLQYEAQLKNMIKNPASALSGDAANLIRGISGIMAAGQSIGGTLSQIDKNFSLKFNSPTAASFSDKFSNWTSTSKDTLQSAMRSAGMRREQYSSDADALNALYNESQQTDGQVAALQTLAKINIRSVQQMQSLGDLMATQNIAANTYMAAQNEKELAKQNSSTVRFKAVPLPSEDTYKTPKF